jgi:hypothetical protein
MFNNFFPENLAFCEIMWKKYCTAGRFARWITKDTNTHSDYVILVAFPQQQWFRECGTLRGISVIFRTGAAIYTAVVVARSTG